MIRQMLMALAIVFSVLSSFAAGPEGVYPLHPSAELTPGDYCHNPDNHRYPEKIAYCNRNVNTADKREIVQMYNDRLGYEIKRENVNGEPTYKIDHLIPLCAGGSNEIKNLWPQHKSVYSITDPMEGLACEKMSLGRLSQKHAVELIFKGKMDHAKVPEVLKELQAL